ncbi:MAG: ribosome biogenesis GTPase Der [Clostridia bacterium]|nr:ribosome biogenesis GTPase Der [Clostridia bacterium]
MKPVIAIVGRPNVGKSALFNRLVGRRISIVEDTPGVTRDRIYADIEWRNIPISLIDTGGIEPDSKDELLSQMRRQAMLAVDLADVIIFVGDIHTGVTSADIAVVDMLRKSKKPIVLAVNKVDKVGDPPPEIYEFYNLDAGDPIAVSAVQSLGLGDLLDACYEHFPENFDKEEEADVIKVAVIGRPNAGKSSLINSILGEQRVIVSDIAGTTRDAIDTYFEKDGKKYLFIDTAGIRRKSKVDETVERYSVMRSYGAVDRADVCLIMIDGNEGVAEQDAKVAGYAHEQGKASIVLVNKWDIVDKDTGTMKKMKIEVQEKLSYMTYAPIEFISAKTGSRIEKVFPLIDSVYEQNSKRITTGALNDILNEATLKVQPPSDKGKRLKIYYGTQPSSNPPTFVLFVNDKTLAHFSYIRYLENQFRSAFGMEGTPIRFIIREKGSDSGPSKWK